MRKPFPAQLANESYEHLSYICRPFAFDLGAQSMIQSEPVEGTDAGLQETISNGGLPVLELRTERNGPLDPLVLDLTKGASKKRILR